MLQIASDDQFLSHALEAFHHQMKHNPVYAEFAGNLGISESSVDSLTAIPFLPVELFKTLRIYASDQPPAITFHSSGTTGSLHSCHHIADLQRYRNTLLAGFRLFYGDPSRYTILALVPSPQEAPHSSLAYMIQTLIQAGNHPGSGFYFREPERLHTLLREAAEDGLMSYPSVTGGQTGQPRILLIGLTYALLDFAERYPVLIPGAIVMETGGMKGRRREMIREEVHGILKQAFQTPAIHSEYGMTELLSQAWSAGEGRFRTPPWMKVLIRDPYDPLGWVTPGRTGGISIIDLANHDSCPFIATQDLGKSEPGNSFSVLGRFDSSELRGCNLMTL